MIIMTKAVMLLIPTKIRIRRTTIKVTVITILIKIIIATTTRDK